MSASRSTLWTVHLLMPTLRSLSSEVSPDSSSNTSARWLADSGAPVFQRSRLEDRSEYYLSPVGAAGHVILGSAEGTLYVLDAEADELTVQHEVSFDEELFATPAILDGTIYLRTTSTLWAFGPPQDS